MSQMNFAIKSPHGVYLIPEESDNEQKIIISSNNPISNSNFSKYCWNIEQFIRPSGFSGLSFLTAFSNENKQKYICCCTDNTFTDKLILIPFTDDVLSEMLKKQTDGGVFGNNLFLVTVRGGGIKHGAYFIEPILQGVQLNNNGDIVKVIRYIGYDKKNGGQYITKSHCRNKSNCIWVTEYPGKHDKIKNKFEISDRDRKVRDSSFDGGGVNYYQKYLKYKQKYLSLKRK